MWNLKYDTNELIHKQKQIHREQTCGCQGGGGWADWEFGVSRCKLLYTGLISSILLYRVRNYTQYPVINQNGQEYENIYIYLNHFAIQQKLTQYYKSTILLFF